MPLSVGDKLPGVTSLRMGADGPEEVDMAAKFAGRKVVLFGLPGAFTGTCTTAHMPSFIRTHDAFAAKGIDEIICVAVNDPFVVDAWTKETGADAAGITVIADAASSFTTAADMNFDAPAIGFYGRSMRYSLYAEDGVVKVIMQEDGPGTCEISAGESLLAEI
ncbi:MAG: peroxiredoxin [Pseudomonadota bacterium]